MDGCDDDDDASVNRFLNGWRPSSFSLEEDEAEAAADVDDEDEYCCFRLPRGKAGGW